MKRITTFLSHADEDKKIAGQLAKELSKYNFDVFVAHDDIVIGDDWENTLKTKIEKQDFFVALLSENFRKAHFTDHEVGFAAAVNKRIFPIRLDDVKPYGFMSKFQSSKKINSKIDPNEVLSLAHDMRSFTDEGQKIIDELIKKFHYADSFREANAIAAKLFDFTISPKQANDIAKAFLDNYQINGSWTARPSCLNFFVNNWNLVKSKYQNKLEPYLKRK